MQIDAVDDDGWDDTLTFQYPRFIMKMKGRFTCTSHALSTLELSIIKPSANRQIDSRVKSE